jgi:uncharacterized protein (DUF1499 family)
MMNILWRWMGSVVVVMVALGVSAWMSVAPAEASIFHFSGSRPGNLGIHDGRFAPCPSTPNCVSSQGTEPAVQIAPLKFSGDKTIAQIKAAVLAQPGSAIISETDSYLYAEFTSSLMGFVDDVEFYADNAAQTVQVRSASRLGESDLGVNRQRIESIRSMM